MKKLFVLAVLLTAVISAKAQHEEEDILIQPRVGMTISNLTDGDKSKINVTYGVEVERFITDQFSLAGGVLFTNQGCKYEIFDESNKSNDYKFNIYYGALPLTANYYVLPGLALKAGLQPAFRVKANMKTNDGTLDYDKALELLFEKDVKLNTFDLSIPVGLSYEFKNITVDARYNIGLTKLYSGLDTSVHNKVFVITLGYKFGF